MTNFIFKSQRTFKKISNLLEIILAEQRHQRQDNVQMLFLLNKLVTDKNLQKQVDEYFEEGEKVGLTDTRVEPPEVDDLD